MREFGSGVLNGSLWTIAVELQFYIIVPLFYFFILNRLKKIKTKNIILSILIILCMFFHIFRSNYFESYQDNTWFKLFGVSFIPWIYMFLTGILFQINFKRVHSLLEGKVIPILIIYVVTSLIAVNYLGGATGTGISFPLFLLLSVLTFSFAYSYPTFSDRMLKGNDISYGVYIYHIPIVNVLLYLGYKGQSWNVILTLLIAVLLATLSWKVIEKPTMKLKKRFY